MNSALESKSLGITLPTKNMKLHNLTEKFYDIFIGWQFLAVHCYLKDAKLYVTQIQFKDTNIYVMQLICNVN